MRFARDAALASTLLVAGLVLGVPAGGESLAVNGLIAYENDAGLTPQIWVMNQDGTHPLRLADGRTPAWSSDGTRLAFVTPDGHLAVIDADGGNKRILDVAGIPPDLPIVSPAWSPDGKTIAFGENDALYSVSSAGGGAIRLAVGYDPAPAWSPDGTRIAYIAQDGALTVMRADGSAAQVVPGVRGEAARGVAWAPDGSVIAYGDPTGGLSTVRLDGSQPTPLIPYLGVNSLSDPAWSPDGTRIAFYDNADICVANVDGSGVARLTYTPVDSIGTTGHPAWQPLPPGSIPAGPPGAIARPVGRWDRNRSWSPACISNWRGLAVTAGTPAGIAAGRLLTVTLTVTNRSDKPLGESGLVALYVSVRNGKFIRVTPTQGNCTRGRYTHFFDCELGALFPGEFARMRVRLRAGSPGMLVLTCSFPVPGDAVVTAPLPPDCLRRIPVH